jgi:hypothetical protein
LANSLAQHSVWTSHRTSSFEECLVVSFPPGCG